MILFDFPVFSALLGKTKFYVIELDLYREDPIRAGSLIVRIKWVGESRGYVDEIESKPPEEFRKEVNTSP